MSLRDHEDEMCKKSDQLRQLQQVDDKAAGDRLRQTLNRPTDTPTTHEQEN